MLNILTTLLLTFDLAIKEDTENLMPIFIIAIILMTVAIIIFIIDLCKKTDSKSKRLDLRMSCILMIIGNIAGFVGTIVGVRVKKMIKADLDPSYEGVGAVLFMVPLLLWIYLCCVCHKWKKEFERREKYQ